MKLSQKSVLMAASAIAFMAVGSLQNAVAGGDKPATTSDMQQQQTPSKACAYLEDSTITAKVKAAIIAESDLSALEIKVDTTDGVVTLTGTVDSPQKMERAAQVAQTIDGVRTVDNKLSVKAPG